MGIVTALLVAACVLAWRQPQQIVLLGTYAAGLLLVAVVGLVDDHRPLSPWLRLAVQAVASALLALGVAGTWGDPGLALLAFAASMVLTNVWNFMDGINGIAASQAMLVAAGLAMIAGGSLGWLALALAASCAGFLPFNFPRARIFLGDVGSGALGYSLAALLIASLAGRTLPWPLLLLPFSAFLVDSGMTLIRRVLRKEPWWTAHAQHAYQRWAAQRGTHTAVTLAYAGWTAAALLAAGSLRMLDLEQSMGLALAWLAVAAAVWTWLQHANPPALAQSDDKDKE